MDSLLRDISLNEKVILNETSALVLPNPDPNHHTENASHSSITASHTGLSGAVNRRLIVTTNNPNDSKPQFTSGPEMKTDRNPERDVTATRAVAPVGGIETSAASASAPAPVQINCKPYVCRKRDASWIL
jgi:hypothetical protein